MSDCTRSWSIPYGAAATCLFLLTFLTLGASIAAAPSSELTFEPKAKLWTHGRTFWLARLEWMTEGQPAIALQRLRLEGESAAEVVEKAYLAYPDNLSLYVGMLQASRSFRETEIPRQKLLLQSKPGDWKTKLRLGAALWITWGTSKERSRQDDTACREAAELLKGVWDTSPEPVAGMLLAELLPAIGWKYQGATQQTIADRLLLLSAGTRAYDSYRAAKRKKWTAAPPSVSLVPPARRRTLAAVVGALWTKAGSRGGPAVVKNGTLIPRYEPIPPLRQAEHAYLERWLRMLMPDWNPPSRGR